MKTDCQNAKMRLTLVISSMCMGGAQRVLSIMADYWTSQGYEITLITLDIVENDFFPLPPAVKRIGLNVMGDSGSPVQAMSRNIKKICRLRMAVRESKPQTIISFLDRTNILVLLASLGLNIPVIVSERSDPRQYQIGRSWSGLRRLLYPKAAAVVVQSDSVREWALGFLKNDDIWTIPNPVLQPAPQTESEKPSLVNGKVIAALGRLSREKGFDILLQAAEQPLKNHPDWTVMILGEGPERLNLERLAADLGIADRVQFRGHIKEPVALLRQADLFVFSSRFEGFPNALLEAMSCGLPVISLDCPTGPREIIRHGIDGLLTAAEDSHALAAAMDRLMSNPMERQQLAARAPEVITRFGIERVMALWGNLLPQRLPRT